jgi:hypothetical protein
VDVSAEGLQEACTALRRPLLNLRRGVDEVQIMRFDVSATRLARGFGFFHSRPNCSLDWRNEDASRTIEAIRG